MRELREHWRRARKLASLLRNRSYLRGLRYGVAAATEHADVLRWLQCKTIIDVGANVGQFALAARRSCPSARIIAFEPLRDPAKTFRKLFAGDSMVELYEFALGDESGVAQMHISQKNDSSSLLTITELQTATYPGTQHVSDENVDIRRLAQVIGDAPLESPILLKIDVQGAELQVLRGCGQLLSNIAYVYAECSFVELYASQGLAPHVVAFLRDYGLDLRGIHNVNYDSTGKAVQADFLFARTASNGRAP
jgi:FkbM family methyltransferase